MSVNISHQVCADTVIFLVFKILRHAAALQLIINVCHSSTSIAACSQVVVVGTACLLPETQRAQ